MTKASRIMALYKEGYSNRQIAELVYGEATDAKMAYVRVVTKRRKGRGYSLIDRRYLENGGREVRAKRARERYAAEQAYREAKCKRAAKWERENRVAVNARRRNRIAGLAESGARA